MTKLIVTSRNFANAPANDQKFLPCGKCNMIRLKGAFVSADHRSVVQSKIRIFTDFS